MDSEKQTKLTSSADFLEQCFNSESYIVNKLINNFERTKDVETLDGIAWEFTSKAFGDLEVINYIIYLAYVTFKKGGYKIELLHCNEDGKWDHVDYGVDAISILAGEVLDLDKPSKFKLRVSPSKSHIYTKKYIKQFI